MTSRTAALLAAGSLFVGSSAGAYRPFDSTDADVVERGEVELEFAPVGFLSEDGAETLVVPAVVVNVGLHPRVELVLEGQGLVSLDDDADERRFRLVDTALLLKGLVRRGSLQGGQGPSLALEGGVLLPTLHDENGLGAEGLVAASQRWGSLTLHLNGTLERTRAETWAVGAGLIVEGPARFGVRPVAEATFVRELDEGSTGSGLIGLIWEASNALAFDLAFRVARDDGSDVHELRAGVTWSVARWGGRP